MTRRALWILTIIILVAGDVNAQQQPRGRLAVDIARDPLTAADAAALGLKDAAGVFVQGVEPGGPAHAAGIRAEDVIVAFNGRTPSSAAELASWISATTAGERVTLSVVRKGAAMTVTATVAAAAAAAAPPSVRKVVPAPESMTPEQIGFGLQLAAVDGKVPGAPQAGALVQDVISRGGADRGGLAQGDVILTINGAAVATAADATKVLDAVPSGGRVRVRYWRPDGSGGAERAAFLIRP